HRRYTRYINFQKGWKGHLWQGRFSSCSMDEMFLFAVARYIALNPAKANLVKRPELYAWSSTKAHLQGEDDILVKVEPLAELIGNWRELLASDLTDKEYETIRRHERTGRPMGDVSFLGMLEKLTGRSFQRQKPGPKKKN
ncbi:MAG: transposase, partial [Desulfobulbaceae bacterium]|nr:transposase [Desulfobulbaceae bacterium]